MPAPDFEFLEGFDKYGPVGQVNPQFLWAGEYDISNNDSGPTDANWGLQIGSPLSSPRGGSLRMWAGGNNLGMAIRKTLGVNYARCIGCFYILWDGNTVRAYGIPVFYDGASAQCTLRIDPNGTLQVRRGDFGSTLIDSSTLVLQQNVVQFVAFDFTFHNSLGKAKIWREGDLILDVSNVDMCATANNYVNGFGYRNQWANTSSDCSIDHFYLGFYSASGGAEQPPITGAYIETDFPQSDDTRQFDFGTGQAGAGRKWQPSYNFMGTGTGAILKKITVLEACNIADFRPMPRETKSTMKMKALLYADAGGQPGAQLATGTEVIGTTSGARVTLPFAAPIAVAAGDYWVGVLKDQTCNMDIGAYGDAYTITGTYAGGASNPASGMAAVNSIEGYVTLTGVNAAYPQVHAPASLDYQYNISDVVGEYDLFNFPALSEIPSVIHTMQVKVLAGKDDAGSRSMSIQTKSGLTTSKGTAGNFMVPSSEGWKATNYQVNPDTGLPWSGNLAGLKHGYKIEA